MKSLACTLLLASTSTILALSAPAHAAERAPAETQLTAAPLTLEWNARVRHEAVDDDAFARRAAATTLRVRLGARYRIGAGWSALVEGEGVAALEDRYDSGANGHAEYPAVTDPAGIELNQAWVGWRNAHAAATLGRQRVLVDNQRWVGNSGWRQNEQTFDAAALEWTPSDAIKARYIWLDRAHRVSGDDARNVLARERDLDTHLLDLGIVTGSQQWGVYSYAHHDRDVPAASTLTTGVRWTGARVGAEGGVVPGWRVEAARQTGHANNPRDFSHDYWLLEPSLAWRGVTWRAGWEHQGGDGEHALQTPLATLHAFNGWADRFGVTPPGGLEDRYVAAGGALGRGATSSRLKWALAWHDFRADEGGRYGREWDASLAFPLHGGLSGLVKLADYRSAGFATDTTKLWLQLEWVRP